VICVSTNTLHHVGRFNACGFWRVGHNTDLMTSHVLGVIWQALSAILSSVTQHQYV